MFTYLTHVYSDIHLYMFITVSAVDWWDSADDVTPTFCSIMTSLPPFALWWRHSHLLLLLYTHILPCTTYTSYQSYQVTSFNMIWYYLLHFTVLYHITSQDMTWKQQKSNLFLRALKTPAKRQITWQTIFPSYRNRGRRKSSKFSQKIFLRCWWRWRHRSHE